MNRRRKPASPVVVSASAQWISDIDHDRTRREELIARMATDSLGEEDEERDQFVARGMQLFNRGGTKKRRFAHGETIDAARLEIDRKTGRLVGEVRAVIRGPPEHVVAYLMDLNGKHFNSKLNPKIVVRYEAREVKSVHHTVAFLEFKTPPFTNRTFLLSLVWKKLSDDPRTYAWVAMSIDRHHSLSSHEEAHAVRGGMEKCVLLTDIGDGSTRLDYAVAADLKGRFPEHFTQKIALPQNMR